MAGERATMASSIDKKEYLHWYQRKHSRRSLLQQSNPPPSASLDSGTSHFFNQHPQDPFPTSGSEHSSNVDLQPTPSGPSLIPCISPGLPPVAHGGNKKQVRWRNETHPSIYPRWAQGLPGRGVNPVAVSGEREVFPLFLSSHSRGPGAPKHCISYPGSPSIMGLF